MINQIAEDFKSGVRAGTGELGRRVPDCVFVRLGGGGGMAKLV